LVLAVTIFPHGLIATLTSEATLSQELHTVGLLQLHVLIGYRWQNIGLSPDHSGSTAMYATSCRNSPHRTCTFQCIRLSSETIVIERTSLVEPSAFRVPPLPVSRSHLLPFPVSWALPQALEYYGNSVAMSLAACRRSRIDARQTCSTFRCPFRFLSPVHCRSLTAESIQSD
jgi:hypothetical protein